MRSIREVEIAVIMGLVLLGLTHLATHQPGFYSTGFPIPYSYNDPAVCGNAPVTTGSACRAYDPLLVALDYLFWVAIAFVFVLVVDIARVRFASHPEKSTKETAASDPVMSS